MAAHDINIRIEFLGSTQKPYGDTKTRTRYHITHESWQGEVEPLTGPMAEQYVIPVALFNKDGERRPMRDEIDRSDPGQYFRGWLEYFKEIEPGVWESLHISPSTD